jgi:hypothetical protein
MGLAREVGHTGGGKGGRGTPFLPQGCKARRAAACVALAPHTAHRAHLGRSAVRRLSRLAVLQESGARTRLRCAHARSVPFPNVYTKFAIESRYQRSGAHIWSIRKHARAPRTLALILQATFRSHQPPLLARLYRLPSVSSRRLERGLAGGPFTVPARQRTAGASAGGRACGRVEVGRSVAKTAKRGGGEEGGGAGLRTMARQMGW